MRVIFFIFFAALHLSCHNAVNNGPVLYSGGPALAGKWQTVLRFPVPVQVAAAWGVLLMHSEE